MKKSRILIVEDEVAIAIDIAMNLESFGFDVVAIAHNATDALEALKSHEADLVMLDINLGGVVSGIDIAKTIEKKYGIPFIYLTSYADQDTMDKAIGTFPASYLVKPYKEKDLAPAVKLALANKKASGAQNLPSIEVLNKKLLSKITKAEYHVIELLVDGKTNLEISEHLFISKNTVKSHVRNVYSKLSINSKSLLIKVLREM